MSVWPMPWVRRVRLDGSAYLSCGNPVKGAHNQFNICDDPDIGNLIASAPDLYREGEQSALTLEEAAKVFAGTGFPGMADICRAQAKKQRAAGIKARGEPVSADGLAEPSNASDPIDLGSIPGAVR